MEFDREKLNNELINKYKESDEFDVDVKPGIPLKFIIPVILLFIIISVIVLWKSGIFGTKEYEVPLIKSDITDDLRQKPEDPGGMYIANKDKMIYNAIAEEKNKQLPKVIQILPKAEEPIARSTFEKTKSAEEIEAENNDGFKAASDAKPEIAKQDNKADITAKKQEIATNTDKISLQRAKSDEEVDKFYNQITPEDLKQAPLPIARTKKPIKNDKKDSSVKIQLGSFKSADDVRNQWNIIKSKHSKLIGNLDLKVEKADLGNKGIFFRLRLSGIKSNSKARKICESLISKNQGCFVVKN